MSDVKELKEFYDYMKSLDAGINLKIETKTKGGYVLHYSKRDVFGSKSVLLLREMKEELDEIFSYLNCSSSPKMYELQLTGLY